MPFIQPVDETLSFVSAQVNDRTCPLEIGGVPGTSLDLQRAHGAGGGSQKKHRHEDHNDVQFES